MSPVGQLSAPTNRRSDPGYAGGVRGLLWLTWRQHRWTVIGTLVLAAVLVGWMTYLSVELTSLWHQCHETFCAEDSPQGRRLGGSSSLVLTLAVLSQVVQWMPLLIGVFVGVPVLTREHEQRTLLLAWSQDVSPQRWLWTRLALLGLFVAAVTSAVAGVSDHLERLQARVAPVSLFEYGPFLNTAMLPAVISLCWFAVGVALGAAIKRTLPAVFAVIVGFVGLTYLVRWRYPTLMEPLTAHRVIGGPGVGVLRDNALVVKGGIIDYGVDGPSGAFDASGRELSGAELQRLCPPDNGTGRTLACFVEHNLQQHIQYQPGSRIPEFHLIVAGGYLGLTVLALLVVWWIVRRTDLSAG
ncbi:MULTISPECIES: ABC transporter permease [unclassified Micromonospora]|uniref:ABC transporter permease n=1 Tax=unclassified Micromonospora TaxID=2617518 RepID=UPI001B371533|nr:MULTISPECIES: ABC transporter permease [unclassified Micromonospora]MBQ1044257.1 ABC transporter permease [Micromonospora sp. C72]MBQ1058409.1 ABC transporter permease [Micromonospora sp. C32]